MQNELLLVASLIVIYAMVLLWHVAFGKAGLLCWIVFATIAANIEVMLVVDAFGMSQTLGNILFASTFLTTDILSELYDKKTAKDAVNIGILTSICFIVISQSWLLYQPGAGDMLAGHFRLIFSNTPRIMLTGFIVYAIVQRFDVWAYHAWWQFTEKRFGTRSGFLWLRNNGSTLLSQLINTVLFTLGAFWGVYDGGTLVSIMLASYVVFIVTSLADTPVVYLARYLHNRKKHA